MKYSILIICILFPIVLLSQELLQDHLYVSKIDLLPESFNSQQNIILKEKNGSTVAINSKIFNIDSSIFMEIYNDSKLDTIKLSRNLDSIRWNTIFDFDFLGDDIVLLSGYEIQFYAKKEKYYEHYKTIEFPILCMQVFVQDSTIMCNAFMPSGSNRKDTNKCASVVIPLDNSEMSYCSYPNPIGLQYVMAQPRKIMDYDGANVLLSSITKYQVIIYNNGDPIDTLSRNSEFWIDANSPQRSDREVLNDKVPQRNFEGMLDNLNKMSLMSNVSFSGDFIVVSWTSPDSAGSKVKYYDVWKKENGKYRPYKTDLIGLNGFKDLDAKFNPNSFDTGTFHIFGKSTISSIIPLSLEIKDDLYNLSNREVNKLNDSYMLDNNLRYSILVRNVKW